MSDFSNYIDNKNQVDKTLFELKQQITHDIDCSQDAEFINKALSQYTYITIEDKEKIRSLYLDNTNANNKTTALNRLFTLVKLQKEK